MLLFAEGQNPSRWLAMRVITWPSTTTNQHFYSRHDRASTEENRYGTGKIVGLDEVASLKVNGARRLHVLLYSYRVITNTPGDNDCGTWIRYWDFDKTPWIKCTYIEKYIITKLCVSTGLTRLTKNSLYIHINWQELMCIGHLWTLR